VISDGNTGKEGKDKPRGRMEGMERREWKGKLRPIKVFTSRRLCSLVVGRNIRGNMQGVNAVTPTVAFG